MEYQLLSNLISDKAVCRIALGLILYYLIRLYRAEDFTQIGYLGNFNREFTQTLPLGFSSLQKWILINRRRKAKGNNAYIIAKKPHLHLVWKRLSRILLICWVLDFFLLVQTKLRIYSSSDYFNILNEKNTFIFPLSERFKVFKHVIDYCTVISIQYSVQYWIVLFKLILTWGSVRYCHVAPSQYIGICTFQLILWCRAVLCKKVLNLFKSITVQLYHCTTS